MATREVLQLGNPLLRQRSVEVVDPQSPEIVQTMTDLKDTLHELQRIHGKGGGLAAPQIGSLTRMVYVNARGRSLFLINPVIDARSDELFDVWDFCFSAGASFLAKVSRHLRISVDYQDATGSSVREECEGCFSELLQHEIDHLDGTLFIDHITNPETITMALEWDKTHAYRQ